jgi:cytochrome c peroxidase
MHNGQFDSLEDIVRFYGDVSNLARAGTLRNGAPQLKAIALIDQNVAPLAAFLRSLNEDYE